jgi:hypothetical protein
VVGIVAGGVFIILLILGILWWKGFIGPANTLEQGIFFFFFYNGYVLFALLG